MLKQNTPLLIHFTRIAILIFFIQVFSSCVRTVDPLEDIQAYRPDDKYFKSGLVSLHFLTEVSPVSALDSLYGQYMNYYGLPKDASAAADGEYVGASPEDAFEYSHIAKIRIKDGKIISIDYNEVNREGKGKQENQEYCKEMSISGTSPDIAYPVMEDQLIEVQDITELDAVSGASYSLYRLRYAVMIALMKAEMRKE